MIGKASFWAGHIVSGIAAAFFLVDGVMKLAKPAVVMEATQQLGYPESEIVGIGILLLCCTLLYVLPRTSIFGAILLTAYMGGAVASQVRVNAGTFNITFAVFFGILVWLGLWLRDGRIRQLLA